MSDHKKTCELIIEDLRSELAAERAKVEKLELEVEFLKQWYNAKDTSFREMMTTFSTLDLDTKNKLIRLSESLNDLNQEGETK